MPCAFPTSASASVYAYNNVPQIDFFQFTDGSAAPVTLALKDEQTDITAPEVNDVDSIQSVKKREAKPASGYIPHG